MSMLLSRAETRWYCRRTSYTAFSFNTIDRFSLCRIASRWWTMTVVSPSRLVFANEMTEQYTDPISAVAVANVLR